MEKRLLIVLVLLSLLTALIGVAANPMGGTATLLGVGFSGGKVVFTFKVTGDYSAEDLEGSMMVGGQSYNLQCRKVSEDIVKCTAPKKHAENNTVTVNWGGATYTTEVDDAPDAGGHQTGYCYEVWTWNTGDEVPDGWVENGPHCQDAPAQYEDEIQAPVPYNGGEPGPHTFMKERQCTGINRVGDAYYYNGCWDN